MIWFSAPWPNIWTPGGLKMGQILGVQALTENVFIWLTSNLECLHIVRVFRNDLILGPLATVYEWFKFEAFTDSRVVSGDWAIFTSSYGSQTMNISTSYVRWFLFLLPQEGRYKLFV